MQINNYLCEGQGPPLLPNKARIFYKALYGGVVLKKTVTSKFGFEQSVFDRYPHLLSFIFAAVAQRSEQRPYKPEVPGPNPGGSTTF